MEPYDASTRRLLHGERRERLAASAGGGLFPLERRLGLLLIALGARLAAEERPVPPRLRPRRGAPARRAAW